jgi:hypothetical protein
MNSTISYLFGADVTAQQYTKGAILLDFVDGKTRELLWRVDISDI